MESKEPTQHLKMNEIKSSEEQPKEKIRYCDMDKNQKREYKKLKQRERRCNTSYKEEEYQRVIDKHGKGVKRQNRNKVEHFEEILKAKML